MKVLITGGAGFIGSTVASACSDAGMEVIIIDDLSTGMRSFGSRFCFYEGDYGDENIIDQIFTDHPDIYAVIHCAASIIVPESMTNPLKYYKNNVGKMPDFLAALIGTQCRTIIFSSTAAVYDDSGAHIVDEEAPVMPRSPYAKSKRMAECMLSDLARVTDMRVVVLRYFNPIGADPSLRTGQQNPHPSHVLGKLLDAQATGSEFMITGTNWPTRDGSGIRDYVHVWDLAQAHVAAIAEIGSIFAGKTIGPNYDVINLGTGTGTTVFELIRAFEKVTGSSITCVVGPRRPGDVIGCSASRQKAGRVLSWAPRLSIDEGIADAISWSAVRPSMLGR